MLNSRAVSRPGFSRIAVCLDQRRGETLLRRLRYALEDPARLAEDFQVAPDQDGDPIGEMDDLAGEGDRRAVERCPAPAVPGHVVIADDRSRGREEVVAADEPMAALGVKVRAIHLEAERFHPLVLRYRTQIVQQAREQDRAALLRREAGLTDDPEAEIGDALVVVDDLRADQIQRLGQAHRHLEQGDPHLAEHRRCPGPPSGDP
jgi:hypothetical protein